MHGLQLFKIKLFILSHVCKNIYVIILGVLWTMLWSKLQLQSKMVGVWNSTKCNKAMLSSTSTALNKTWTSDTHQFVLGRGWVWVCRREERVEQKRWEEGPRWLDKHKNTPCHHTTSPCTLHPQIPVGWRFWKTHRIPHHHLQPTCSLKLSHGGLVSYCQSQPLPCLVFSNIHPTATTISCAPPHHLPHSSYTTLPNGAPETEP